MNIFFQSLFLKIPGLRIRNSTPLLFHAAWSICKCWASLVYHCCSKHWQIQWPKSFAWMQKDYAPPCRVSVKHRLHNVKSVKCFLVLHFTDFLFRGFNFSGLPFNDISLNKKFHFFLNRHYFIKQPWCYSFINICEKKYFFEALQGKKNCRKKFFFQHIKFDIRFSVPKNIFIDHESIFWAFFSVRNNIHPL